MTDPTKMDASPPPQELLDAIHEEIDNYVGEVGGEDEEDEGGDEEKEGNYPLTTTEMAEYITEFISQAGNPTVVTNGESTIHTKIRRGSKLDIAAFSASFETAIVSVGEQPDPEKAYEKEEPGEYFGKLYGIRVDETKFPYVPLLVTTYSENRERAVEIHTYMEEVLSDTFEGQIFEDPLDVVSREDRENAYKAITESIENWYNTYGSLESLDQLDALSAQLTEIAEDVEIEIEIPPEKVSEDEEFAIAGEEEQQSQVELSEEERAALEEFASQQEVEEMEEEEQKEEMYYDYQTRRQVSADDLQEFVEETEIAFVFDPLVEPGKQVDDVTGEVFVSLVGYPYRQALVPVLVATPETGEDAVNRLQLLHYGMTIQCKTGERLFVTE